jgi:hypothetical protein
MLGCPTVARPGTVPTVVGSLASLGAVLGLLACGASGSAAPGRDAAAVDSSVDASDSSTTMDAEKSSDVVQEAEASFTEAKHQIPTVPFQGGPVFAHPTLVTITFAGDPERSFDETLGGFLVQSKWLETVGKEYGVGTGSQVVVELGEAPAQIDDVDIQGLILSLIQKGTVPDIDGGVLVPPFPQEDAGPDASDDAGEDATVDAGSGGDASDASDASDGGDGGDAGDADASDGDVVARDSGGSSPDASAELLLPPIIYMVFFPMTTTVTVEGEALCQYSGGGYHYQIAQALNGQTFAYAVVSACPGQGAAEEVLQFAASHEFIEAATDPVISAPAWSLNDPSSPWAIFGGEVADMCAFIEPQWSEGAYDQLTRVYSNVAAKAGGDPCVPEPVPYFATDVEPETFVQLTPGETATFDVTGWSTTPVGDWSISAEPYVSSPAGLQPNLVLGSSTLNNGQRTTLTVTMPAGTPSDSYALVLLYSAQSQSDFTASLIGVYTPQ